MTKPIKYKTCEQVINEKRAADAERLRQLAEQKAELLEALLNLVNAVSGDTIENLKIAIVDAKAIIKKATQ